MAEQREESPRVAGGVRERAERTRTRRVHAPATDIYDTDGGLVILVDLPGVAPAAAEVMLEQNVLTIRAHTTDVTPPGYHLVYREFESGDFERAFTLSDGIDASRIEAQAKDGVLRVFLPKMGPAPSQRIQVRTG